MRSNTTTATKNPDKGCSVRDRSCYHNTDDLGYTER